LASPREGIRASSHRGTRSKPSWLISGRYVGVFRFVLVRDALAERLKRLVERPALLAEVVVGIPEFAGGDDEIDHVLREFGATSWREKQLGGHLYGLTLANNAVDATNDIDIAAGEVASTESDPVLMVLASAFTKRLDAAWAVGANQGGLDTGSVGNNIYYVWLIQRSDTGVVDALFSLSKTSPTMPANYDRKALIGSFARVSATNNVPRSYSQREVTPWVAYTPTVAGLGTPTQVLVYSRRNGPDLEVRGQLTSGISTVTTLSISLGVEGVNGGLTVSSVFNGRYLAGTAIRSAVGAESYTVLATDGQTALNFGVQSSGRSGTTAVSGSTILTSGDVLLFNASVPIQGWN